MSLVRGQAAFMLHLCELVRRAGELGFSVSGGELFRTPEQQAAHVKNGRCRTMNSQHLKRLAVDLNFFRESADGSLALIQDANELRPLGEYWEGLDPNNRWGGNWSSFKDLPHFERMDMADEVPAATPQATSLAAQAANSPLAAQAALAAQALRPSRPAPFLLQAPVGPKASNQRDDVETVQRLLNHGAAAGVFTLDAPLKPDGVFGAKTLEALMGFKRARLGEQAPDGRVTPDCSTLAALLTGLPQEPGHVHLSLLYLRASDESLELLAPRLLKVMASRNIDTPLRRAHFLAQVGHESGELRFTAELASGQAYEGRKDLGNVEPGDGPRYKGRGLIQLTGRANYAEYGRDLRREQELLDNPRLVESDPELCVDVAGWYWTKRDLNRLADADDLTSVTRRINGGLNGLDDRRRLLGRAKALV